MGKEDEIGTEACGWARAKVFNCNKTSVGRAIAFGCATRCHLSVHSLAMPRSGLVDDSHGGSGGGRGVRGGRCGWCGRGGRGRGGGEGVGGGWGGGVTGGGDGGGGGGGGWGGGDGGATSWVVFAVDGGSVNACLAAALTRVMRGTVPIPAVPSVSVLHSAVVGGSVASLRYPLSIFNKILLSTPHPSILSPLFHPLQPCCP